MDQPNASDGRAVSPPDLTATPNGGVLITQSWGGEPTSPTFTELGSEGVQLWSYAPTGPLGVTTEYETPIADANGVVALPYSYEATCSDGVTKTCSGFEIDFVSQDTGLTVFRVNNGPTPPTAPHTAGGVTTRLP